MENTITLTSRHGDKHKLIYIGDNEYRVESAEEWMPISLIGYKENYEAIDFDGGPMIYVQDIVGSHVVEQIYEKEGVGIVIRFEDDSKMSLEQENRRKNA